MQELVINSKDCEIHYWLREGSSEKYLIFLHGVALDHTIFAKQFPAMPEDYNLIALDVRAHGKSILESSKRFYYNDIINDIVAICNKHNIKSAVFIGHSMGGYLSQNIAINFPDLARGIILISSMNSSKQEGIADKIQVKIADFIYKLAPEKMIKYLFGIFSNGNKSTKQYIRQRFDTFGKYRFVQVMSSVANYLYLGFDVSISCPKLVILGEKDRTGHLGKMRRQWKNDSTTTKILISDAGHNPNQDKPDEVNVTIIDFLKKIDE